MAAKKEKVQELGFRVTDNPDSTSGSLFFPLVGVRDFKQIDAVLVEAVTGKVYDPDWLKLLDKHGVTNALAMQGLLAVSIRHAKDASVDDVVEFINNLPLHGGITLEIPEDKKAKADDPPTPADETET